MLVEQNWAYLTLDCRQCSDIMLPSWYSSLLKLNVRKTTLTDRQVGAYDKGSYRVAYVAELNYSNKTKLNRVNCVQNCTWLCSDRLNILFNIPRVFSF